MAICGWCAVEYTTAAVFHVCQDGTTFPDRMQKTSQELAEQRERKDRARAGYAVMGDQPAVSKELVPVKDSQLPKQPNTVGNYFNWNAGDLYMAKKLKIKI